MKKKQLDQQNWSGKFEFTVHNDFNFLNAIINLFFVTILAFMISFLDQHSNQTKLSCLRGQEKGQQLEIGKQ